MSRVHAVVLVLVSAAAPAAAAPLRLPEFFAKLIEKAKLIAYDANALLAKPNPKEPVAFCRTRAECSPYCSGANPVPSRIREVLRQRGHEEPLLVDPAVAVQDELRRLGCEPAGGSDLKAASANCGIRFIKPSKNRKVMPRVITGLARAALEAGARGYVLRVGSTYRPITEQTRKVCKNIAKGLGEICGPTIACPGGSKHGSGYAIDVGLYRDDRPVTPLSGKAGSCASRKKKVLASAHKTALAKIMFAAGWWWYCQELWHFEYSRLPGDATGVNSLDAIGKK